jgi:hypothetical protein
MQSVSSIITWSKIKSRIEMEYAISIKEKERS